jgi:hypothetical protein
MKCEILFGPEIGKVKHFANNDPTAHSLMQSGLIRLIENEPGDWVRAQNGAMFPVSEPPAVPRWYVGTFTANHRIHKFEQQGVPTAMPAIFFEVGSTNREIYSGDPEDAAQGFGKRTVPAEVLKQYAQAHKEFWKGRQ